MDSAPDTTAPGTRIYHLTENNAQITVAITPGKLNVSDQDVQTWVHRSATAQEKYFGRFPVNRASIVIRAAEVGSIGDGLTNDEGIRVTVGPDADKAALDDDWIMVHEMFHLAFPDLDDPHIWLNEGLASYLEPLARARVGTLSTERVWGDLIDGCPKGQPMPGDHGLDHTHTQGRTYWGGSIFCLMADLQIREQTHNAKSLDTAMRAILNQGGDRYQHWSMEQVIAACDNATGTHVVRDLYKEMADKPVTVDLDLIWRRVGVRRQDGKVVFDDSAPLADIRRSITMP